MRKPDDYIHPHMVEYESPDRTGFFSMPVLPFLIGEPWDEVALDFVQCLRPEGVRVILFNHSEKCDARTWRVTVYLDENKLIRSIYQEVSVGLRTFEYGDGADRWIAEKQELAK